MKKLFLLCIIPLSVFAATPEQVEEYLSLSHAEEDIISLESRYANMQKSFANNNQQYDMQMLMVRFKEKLQQVVSESEMNKILKNYDNLLYLQFISNKLTQESTISNTLIESLKNDSDYEERLKLVKEINTVLNKREVVGIMYDDLMTPFLKNAIGGKTLNEKTINTSKENYITSVIQNSQTNILYSTKEFTLEELKELLAIIKTPSVEHETKAVYRATAYAFKEFFLSLSKHYNIAQHQAHQTDNNNTKI